MSYLNTTVKNFVGESSGGGLHWRRWGTRARPGTQRPRTSPKTQRRRVSPDTQRRRGSPEMKRRRASPERSSRELHRIHSSREFHQKRSGGNFTRDAGWKILAGDVAVEGFTIAAGRNNRFSCFTKFIIRN
ncbi:Uncharacterized protein Rs2_02849 [Raphanus sativus]|nr:Uncharacterized protein Rs2_02849 [Raphanus sativus]